MGSIGCSASISMWQMGPSGSACLNLCQVVQGHPVELPASLKNNVVCLEAEGSRLYLLGMSHVSKVSVKQVGLSPCVKDLP